MLRDCDSSNVWESSFIAVNMHPLHRISFDDWMKKITSYVEAAKKFDPEVIDVTELLPKSWCEQPLARRREWLAIVKQSNESWDVDLISKLRSSGMSLQNLSQIFKIYNAEMSIKKAIAATPGTPPRKKSGSATTPSNDATGNKAKMIYHLFKVPGTKMSPEQKFQHMVTVRNRTLGPKKGITVSPFLDVEVSPDNNRFLQLSADDLNMHRVLQQSTCKHGKRRKVARRALTALGTVSGVAGVLNDPEHIEEIKAGLQFAASLEDVKSKERQRKQAIAAEKHKKAVIAKRIRKEKKARTAAQRKLLYTAVRTKLRLSDAQQIDQSHVSQLSIPQLKAVAFVDCKEATLKGKVAEMRQQLSALLPEPVEVTSVVATTSAFPEYETQDDLYDSEATDIENDPVRDIVELDELRVGEIVEVFWEGENTWFEGEVTNVDLEDRHFEILYSSDGVRLYHREQDYPVRYST